MRSRTYRYRNVNASGEADKWRTVTTPDDAVCGVFRHRDRDHHTVGIIEHHVDGEWRHWMDCEYDIPSRCRSRRREVSPAGKRSSWICQLDATHTGPHRHLTGHRKWVVGVENDG